MQQEIEATYPDVSHDELREKLKTLGATLKQPMHVMKKAIYDYPDLRLDAIASWIRVREEAGKITMGYKRRQSETVEGMYEVEFDISDYDKAREFLEAIGLKTKALQESKREVWQLDDCTVTLDEWPWIPTYAEVEGPNESSVRGVSSKLDLDYDTAMFDSIDAIYLKHFDVTRTEISSVLIAFGPVPEWLEAKRRK